ncbi:hypothetical protein [Halomonas sp.]|uniref:hypothetical protein n=1 Tax=Halomonas sp. TaxID=1486246 RepID=UPI003A1039A8
MEGIAVHGVQLSAVPGEPHGAHPIATMECHACHEVDHRSGERRVVSETHDFHAPFVQPRRELRAPFDSGKARSYHRGVVRDEGRPARVHIRQSPDVFVRLFEASEAEEDICAFGKRERRSDGIRRRLSEFDEPIRLLERAFIVTDCGIAGERIVVANVELPRASWCQEFQRLLRYVMNLHVTRLHVRVVAQEHDDRIEIPHFVEVVEDRQELFKRFVTARQAKERTTPNQPQS